MNADELSWTGLGWAGGWPNANLTIPPPSNAIGCRAIFIGSATLWTTGGEGFGLRLDAPLIAGQTYSFDFTYVSHGTGSDGAFSPGFYTNSTPDIGYFVSNLPAVGNAWTTNTFSFTATASQSGHTWILITTSPDGSSGLINSFCSTCNVPQPLNCSLNLGNDIILCVGETLMLDAQNPGASFLWNDNSTASTLTVSQAGTYWVSVTDGSCSVSDTIHVNYTNYPLVDLGNDTVLCENQAFSISLSDLNLTYLWNDNTTVTSKIFPLAGTYWVDASNGSCVTRDSILVAYNPAPTVNFGNDTMLCVGETLMLDAQNAGASFLWNDNSTASTLTVSQAGTYWVSVSNGLCSEADTIDVNYTNYPIVNLGNDTVLCDHLTFSISLSDVSLTYLWNDNTTITSKSFPLAGTYWVDASNGSCVTRDSILVTYNPTPVLNLGNDTILCDDQIFSLSLTDLSLSYLWNDNTTVNFKSFPLAGTYWVEASNGNCNTRDSIEVSYQSYPVLDLGLDTVLCPAKTYAFDVFNAGASYLWSDQTTASSFIVTQTGSYWVEIEIQQCKVSDTIVFSNFVPYHYFFDEVACKGELVNLDVSSYSGTYLWNNQTDLPVLDVAESGIYEVLISDQCGTNQVDFRVDFNSCGCFMYLPNAFTPNGDEKNQNFEVHYDCELDEFKLEIFNRWGEVIFETNDPQIGWDGSYGDQLVQTGIYVYKLEYNTLEDPEKIKKMGHVSVLK